MKRCSKCKELKDLKSFGKRKRNEDGYDTNCKKCRKEYYIKKREERLIYQQEYDKLNQSIINSKKKVKRSTNNLFRIKDNISSLLRNSLKGFKNYSKSEDILNCSIDYFIEYISEKFTEGMSWENHGEWELDHIKPISLAKDINELYELNKYSNFQPLWKSDNRKKSNHYKT
jgi:hypothetical protein